MKIKRQPVVIERYKVNEELGLTQTQIEKRKQERLVNKTKLSASKSLLSIFLSNIFTFFNLIWAIIFGALVAVRAYSDLLFIIPILFNTAISIIQEIKAKITVEKLSLVSMPKVKTLREGSIVSVMADKLVLDDIIILELGSQIPADSVILDGDVEVNESLLTGESKSVKKTKGDTLYAGSFLLSGACKCLVNKIGKESYIQTIALEAKKFKSPNSNLLKDINALIKYIGIIIVPVGALMLINNYYAYSKNIEIAIAKTCGSLTGMVPAGMFLLITIALTVGVIKLAQKKTLVRELYSIEMLARTNMLCLDKTGTITDGTMQVSEFVILEDSYKDSICDYVTTMLSAQSYNNASANAMIEYFGSETKKKVTNNINFSSERKYFATEFGEETYAIGAPEFICKKISKAVMTVINEKTMQGKRVLAVARADSGLVNGEKPDNFEILGLIIIEDHIRPNAIETIKWFKDNGVAIKIISGDNPQTVSNIAKRVGVENAEQCVSLEGKSLTEVAQIAEKFTVFGRVSPEQKHILIKTLKTRGFVVAMTGDGVNDTLALKEADCSIAMADGSEVARNISDLVLLDSNFTSLPAVVKEGRQVVNNVQQSSTLFLMKTICTILLSIITIITLTPYPFSPKQLLLLELFVIGLPSVILALQPNEKLITGNFIPVVMRKCIPRGLLLLSNLLVVIFLGRFNILSVEEVASLSTLLLVAIGYINLFMLCIPLNLIRGACLAVCGFLILASSFIMPDFFGITVLSLKTILLFFIQLCLSLPLALYADKIYKKVINIKKKK